MSGQAGKGDTYRPVDKRRYDRNYDRIFRRPPPQRRQLTRPKSRP